MFNCKFTSYKPIFNDCFGKKKSEDIQLKNFPYQLSKMFKYRCERQGCTASEKNVPCLKCANSFYCSIKCRNLDTEYHSAICDKTNTRDMIHINTYLVKILYPILVEFSDQRIGIINIRSYSHILCLANSIQDSSHMPMQTDDYGNQLIVRLTTDEDLENHTFFISFIPLEQWQVFNGKHVPTVSNNNYSERMIVNIQLEGMNKPQLFRLPIKL